MNRYSRIGAFYSRAFHSRLAGALVLVGLAVSTGVQAAEPDAISITAPNVKTVGRDEATLAPIEETTEQATIKFDPVTLTTNSGVALLKDSVLEAASRVCNSVTFAMADDDTDTCVRNAVKSAQAQVDEAIARARSTANG